MSSSIEDLFKMTLLMNLKSNDSAIDTIMIIILLSGFQYMFSQNFQKTVKEYFYDFYYKTNKITIEGTRCFKTTNRTTRTDSLFSNRFNAVWKYISLNINSNNDIKSIKEYASSANNLTIWGDDLDDDDIENDKDIYVVNQHRKFTLTKDIFCNVQITCKDAEAKEKVTTSIETITIEIYSNKKSLSEIVSFVDGLTKDYLDNINNSRRNKIFIYTLEYVKPTGYEHDDRRMTSRYEMWNECQFKSTRNFNNIFFDQKIELLKKIDFFQKNEEWYKKEGHPHTLGLALYGPPGTGKTSIIKCIANKLKRHLIVIPFNKIKTQSQFTKYYFEDRYNQNNPDKSIGFEEKIIVFDDIDCMSDLVIDRDKKKPQKEEDKDNTKIMMETITTAVKSVKTSEDLISDICTKEDKITLSFILNIIDGIRETPGRILIVTSNFYDKIDAALKRPGRIDMEIEMKNASVKTICDMYKHYYNQEFPNKRRLKNGIIAPAKIVNTKLTSKNKEEFVEKICNLMKTS